MSPSSNRDYCVKDNFGILVNGIGVSFSSCVIIIYTCGIKNKGASGGIGLIITGLAYVNKNGQSDPWQLGIDRDECIPGLSEMTGAVHKAGGKIVVQISHAGCHSDALLTGMEPMGPSVMENESGPFCKEMTGQYIGRMVSDFGHAALRAKEGVS